MKKKGQVTLYVVFFVSAIIIVLMAAVLIPLGIRINSEFYLTGESLILEANSTISQIQNDTVRQSITGELNSAIGATETNITVLSDLYQYSWILVVGMVAVIVFLSTRRLVEFGSGGFV